MINKVRYNRVIKFVNFGVGNFMAQGQRRERVKVVNNYKDRRVLLSR